jgi:hypothetical protein
MAYNIQYQEDSFMKEDAECECIGHPLTGQEVPILRVHQGAEYGGLTEMEENPVDVFWYNKTGFALQYLVSVPSEEDESILPVSSVQYGGIYGDFYCNFTNTKVTNLI